MKVIVVTDRPVIAAGLDRTLSQSLSSADVRQAQEVGQCLSLLPTWSPDVAVVDLVLSGADREQLCARLRESHTLSVHVVCDAGDALLALTAGADGVATSGGGADGVTQAVRTVLDGHTHVPSALLGGVLQALIQRRRSQPGQASPLQRLTRREHEVLAELAAGRDQTEIARGLAIAPETVKTHIRHLMGKLGARSQIEVVAIAERCHLAQDGVGA